VQMTSVLFTPLSEVNQEKSSLLVLTDDVMAYISSLLSFPDLISLRQVCKRTNQAVHTSCRSPGRKPNLLS
ncbi:hypothetical protein PFISCL1PPCAC_1049, partial [Pristionchus fissidentatus]